MLYGIKSGRVVAVDAITPGDLCVVFGKDGNGARVVNCGICTVQSFHHGGAVVCIRTMSGTIANVSIRQICLVVWSSGSGGKLTKRLSDLLMMQEAYLSERGKEKKAALDAAIEAYVSIAIPKMAIQLGANIPKAPVEPEAKEVKALFTVEEIDQVKSALYGLQGKMANQEDFTILNGFVKTGSGLIPFRVNRSKFGTGVYIWLPAEHAGKFNDTRKRKMLVALGFMGMDGKFIAQ